MRGLITVCLIAISIRKNGVSLIRISSALVCVSLSRGRSCPGINRDFKPYLTEISNIYRHAGKGKIAAGYGQGTAAGKGITRISQSGGNHIGKTYICKLLRALVVKYYPISHGISGGYIAAGIRVGQKLNKLPDVQIACKRRAPNRNIRWLITVAIIPVLIRGLGNRLIRIHAPLIGNYRAVGNSAIDTNPEADGNSVTGIHGSRIYRDCVGICCVKITIITVCRICQGSAIIYNGAGSIACMSGDGIGKHNICGRTSGIGKNHSVFQNVARLDCASVKIGNGLLSVNNG